MDTCLHPLIALPRTPAAYQFDLLWILIGAPEQALTREQIHQRLRALRGEAPTDFDPSVDRSIDVHLSKVRAALAGAHPSGAGLIRTLRGVGYMLVPVGAAKDHDA